MDALALVKFFSWLEDAVAAGGAADLNEVPPIFAPFFLFFFIFLLPPPPLSLVLGCAHVFEWVEARGSTSGVVLLLLVCYATRIVTIGNCSGGQVSVASKLEGFRREDPSCVGLSFATISSVGPNGAIIHYKPEVLAMLLRSLKGEGPTNTYTVVSFLPCAY